MSTQLSTKAQDFTGAIALVDEIVAKYGLANIKEAGNLQRMMALSEGMSALREAITEPMLEKIMELQGSRLGFRTDKDNEATWKDRSGTPQTGYPPLVVKEVTIEALLRGANMTGNEVNIIAKTCYLTKEFFQRAVRQLPGVTDVAVELAVPVKGATEGQALVSGWVRYKLDGKEQVFARTRETDDRDLRISVRVNSGMGADAVLGKAERKLLAALYAKLTGMTIVEGEVDEDDKTLTGSFETGGKRADASPLNERVDQQRKTKPPLSEEEQFELQLERKRKEQQQK
jgi:hypothetical protein